MRKMIKENAKSALRARYWPIVGLELVAGALVGGFSGLSTSISKGDVSDLQEFFGGNSAANQKVLGIVMAVAALVAVVAVLYAFLFGNVISVGISGVRLKAYRREAFGFNDLFSGLKQYGRCVGTMALQTLFIMLGFFCFFVPGIIVALGLFEVPYLLADDPSVSGMAAIRRSWENMRGYKGKLFVLGLSFIGWLVLTALTFGILGIFYTGPYIALAEAGFYHEKHAETAAETPVVEA